MPRVRRLKDARTYEVALERAGLGPVAGIDEAGRGACCGPITIAACILPEKIVPALAGLTDSKKLTAAARSRLEPAIKKHALAWSVVNVSAADIDKRGIQWANVSGMRRAAALLDPAPGYVLTDALRVPGFPTPYLPMIGGDAAARCIAGASVLTKVARDRWMSDLDAQYPGYGFAAHKGYGTRTHVRAVEEFGACAEHRMTYANIAVAHQRWRASHNA